FARPGFDRRLSAARWTGKVRAIRPRDRTRGVQSGQELCDPVLKPPHRLPIVWPAREFCRGEPMIWFYQRGDKHLYYEIRLRDDGPGYELGISYPEGTLLTERFATEAALEQRFKQLRAAL